MIPFGLVLPWWWRWAALLLVAVASAGWGAWRMHVHDAAAYSRLEKDYAQFRERTAVEGQAARQRAHAQIAADQKRKETADADIKNARAAAADAYAGWLRLAASRASGGYLPPAAPSTPSPDRACVDRAEFERAMERLDRGGAAIAQAGDACRVDLDAAKRWANSR